MKLELFMLNRKGKHVRQWSLMIFALLLTTGLFAQREVTGTVTDESGEPLIGATILVKGTTTGTVTDIDGKYSLEVSDDDVLLVSYTGFTPQEVTVGTRSVIDVAMSAGLALDEIVVTGYASQQKKDLTGSVGVVSPDELTDIPTGNVANQLQGRAAGVTVTQDGRPGSPSKVRIRGFSSFQNNDPLYIVDGVPTQDISTLNPNDIESLSVLKDAGAASIYGSRASNGVIIIATKGGAKEGVKVDYDMYLGNQFAGSGPTNLLGAQEYADLQWLVYQNDGTNEVHPIYGPSPAAGGARPTLPSWAANTNWWDETTDNALLMNHNISLSGGNENAQFFGSINYFDQDGIILETTSKRFSGRFNSQFKIKDRVTIGENLTVTRTSRGRGVTTLEEGADIMWIYRAQSIIPVYVNQEIPGLSRTFMPGDFGGTGIASRLGNGENPVAIALRNKDDFRFDTRILGNAFIDVKLVDGLNFRSTAGGTFGTGYFNDYTFATYENAENVATAAFSEGADWGSDWVWTNTLTFDRDFGVHSLLAVAGYEAVKYGIGRGVSGQRAGYFSDAVSFRTLSNGAQIIGAGSGAGTPTTLVSQFLRLDYDFNDRYLISATVRRDGSSRFGEANRYGIFPSVSAAWRVTEEDFFPSGRFLNSLKIRGGYGEMGNQLAVSPVNAFFLFGGGAGDSFYDIGGTGTSSSQGFRPLRIGNPNAKWETNVTTNIGFDASLFNTRLEFIFDWYTKTTQDLLFNPELPGTAGAASAPFVNVAEMKNTGVDLQLIYRENVGDFGFEGNLTFTKYKNEIVKIADGFEFFDTGGSRIGSFSRNQEGRSVSEFYGYQVMGLFQNDAEVAEAATQDGAEPGFFRYADLNNDGVIDPDDRTFIGDPNPDFTYGLNLGFNYKNFDLSAFFFGSEGNDIFNYTRWWTDFWPSFQGQKSVDLLNNSWTPSNTSATVPKASNKSNFSTNTVASSYYIEDGSFLRLKSLQLGYNLPQSVASNIGMTSARIYLQGTNLFTMTDYSGVDPELSGSDLNFGEDEGTYPVVRQLLFGLSIGF